MIAHIKAAGTGGGGGTATWATLTGKPTSFSGYGITGDQTLPGNLTLAGSLKAPIAVIVRASTDGSPHSSYAYEGETSSWATGQDVAQGVARYYAISYYNGSQWKRWFDLSPTGAAAFYGAFAVYALSGNSLVDAVCRTAADWAGMRLRDRNAVTKVEFLWNETLAAHGCPAATAILNSAERLGLCTDGAVKMLFEATKATLSTKLELPTDSGANAAEAVRRDKADALYATAVHSHSNHERVAVTVQTSAGSVALPASPADLDSVRVIVAVAGEVKIQPASGHKIYAGDVAGATSNGSTGYLSGSSVGMVAHLQWVNALTAWVTVSATGNWQIDI